MLINTRGGGVSIWTHFLERYKLFIKWYYTDFQDSYGKIYVQLKCPIALKDVGGYADIESDYSADYYLKDCGGYDCFNRTDGQVIDSRLQAVYALVSPKKGDRILDIGCGRGELSHELSKSGASVTGVDYSEAAIKIAKSTFQEETNHLTYIRQDVFKMENLHQYNKIVMADVVEHIEQKMLERLFERLAQSMKKRLFKKDCVLVIHTAPNKLFYTDWYPEIKRRAAEVGCFLPKEPRSYYEQLMHINEQTPEGLEGALKKYFPAVKVWTGNFFEMDRKKSHEQIIKESSIFALAGVHDAAIDAIVQCYSCAITKPVFEDCKVAITVNEATEPFLLLSEKGGKAEIAITVKNEGRAVLTAMQEYPENISYHILGEDGNVVVYDGERTPVSVLLQPGKEWKVRMCLGNLQNLERGKKYRLDITLVAERGFWFDREGGNMTSVWIKLA